MNKNMKSIILFFICLACLFAGWLGFPRDVHADVVVDPTTIQPNVPSTTLAQDGASLTVQNTTDYKEATNTFSDGNPEYFLITQDPNRDKTVPVTYKGVEYPLTGVFNVNTINSLYSTDPNKNELKPNRTFFIDSGVYEVSDTGQQMYYAFSQPNLSLVGLYKNGSEPAAMFKKSPIPNTVPIAAIRGTIERFGFMHPNIYIENLIFDGGGYDMYPIGGKPFGGTNIPKNRGEYFFMLSGQNGMTDGFVMRDCILQNVGATNVNKGGLFSSYLIQKNVGMNFYIATGQHNIENVIFRNIKTTNTAGSSPGFGILSQNQSNNIYFRNVTIVGDGAHAMAQSIKIEHMDTTLGVPLTANWANYQDEITLPSAANKNYIYVQNFAYDQVKVSPTFRYAMYKTSNGWQAGSAVQIYKSIPDVSADYAVVDLYDNSWVVRDGASVSVSDQLSTIVTVRAAAGDNAPVPNIKIVADGEGKINSFAVPNYGDVAVNLVAVPAVDTLFNSRTLVPFVADGTIELNAVNASSVKLFDFDFHTLAKYTMMEAIAGIDPAAVTLTDPNEAGAILGYPKYETYKPAAATTPKITNATSATFSNDRFTGLTAEIKFASTDPATVPVSGTITLHPQLDGSPTDTFTEDGLPDDLEGKADDQTIHCFSSDPSIATVDSATCEVTGVAEGTVTVTAKAIDSDNNGEIEKPWVQLTVKVTKKVETITPEPSVTPESSITPPGKTLTAPPPLPTENPMMPTRTPGPGTVVPPVPGGDDGEGDSGKTPGKLPNTGFPIGRIHKLPAQPAAKLYASTGLKLGIARLNLELPIVGVPQVDGEWDTTWLDYSVGYLYGSAYPTWNGNTVLTAHVWESNNYPGPFAGLKALQYGDILTIRAFGQKYEYTVRENERIGAGDIKKVMKSETMDWLTLVTCEEYNAKTGAYAGRRMVRAVLTKVE